MTEQSESYQAETGPSPEEIRAILEAPFPVEAHDFKPQAVSRRGDSALAPAYVDSRYYQARLDEVDPAWSSSIEVHLTATFVLIVSTVTVFGHARTATGEAKLDENNTAATAEAQAFKRACAAHGVGRYLYFLGKEWGEYDKDRKRFTEKGLAELKTKLARALGQTVPSSAGGNGSGQRRTQTHAAKAQATASQPSGATTPAPKGNGSAVDVGPTEFWSTANPLIGSKFPDRGAVQAIVAQNTSGGQTDWAGALSALH